MGVCSKRHDLSCSAVFLSGCSGLVSSANTPPPPSTLNVTNVQAGSITTSRLTDRLGNKRPCNSSVDYGTTTAYGNSTPVDSAMVTSHQVTLSGWPQAQPTTTRLIRPTPRVTTGTVANKFQTVGFGLSGTINPATGGSGTTVALSGTASTTTTADSVGNYAFAGLANGTYTIVPSHAGFTFTPNSQSMPVNGGNVRGVNFTATAVPVAPTITTQPANQTVTVGQAATFAVAAGGTAPLATSGRRTE